MSENPNFGDRLDSWKEIASYVGRDVRTVIRWEQEGGFPVHRIPVGQRRSVFAYRHEIDEWLRASDLRDGESTDLAHTPNEEAEALLEVEAGEERTSPDSESHQPPERKAPSSSPTP